MERREKKSNFRVEKLEKYHLSHLIKVNISRAKSC